MYYIISLFLNTTEKIYLLNLNTFQADFLLNPNVAGKKLVPVTERETPHL